jgi:Lon protease-like protein
MSEPTLKELSAALAELPIFPLSQVVLFPHAMLPLHVFEPRYRAMLKDCLATHKAMAIALVVDPSDTDASDNPRILEVAGAGIIVEHQMFPDGRSAILLHGLARVRLEELPFVPPYRRARATLIEDTRAVVPAEDRVALAAAASAFATAVRKRDPNFSFSLPPNLQDGTLADLSAHHLVVDTTVRQKILEQRDPAERVRMVAAELTLQHSQLARDAGEAVN